MFMGNKIKMKWYNKAHTRHIYTQVHTAPQQSDVDGAGGGGGVDMDVSTEVHFVDD